MVQHLKIGRKWLGLGMIPEVTAACLEQVKPILALAPKNGERVAHELAYHYCVKFEEVRIGSDIDRLENEYLRRKRELGFAQLREEVLDPDVDALLFMRTNAAESDRDRWIAVLNLLHTAIRVYWDKFHELTHRITEPPQLWLPFRRKRAESKETVEFVIDQVAGELAFYEPIFGPLVRSAARSGPLTIDDIRKIRSTFAPSASMQAVANAVVKLWPTPAIFFLAKFNGRINNPNKDRALRVELQAQNDAARIEHLRPYPNMRVPHSSPAFASHAAKREVDGWENLSAWTTSTGGALPPIKVYTSAANLNETVYCVMSVS